MAGRAKAQVTEVPGSHAIYVSKPAEIAKLIQQAADARVDLAGFSPHQEAAMVGRGDAAGNACCELVLKEVAPAQFFKAKFSEIRLFKIHGDHPLFVGAKRHTSANLWRRGSV